MCALDSRGARRKLLQLVLVIEGSEPTLAASASQKDPWSARFPHEIWSVQHALAKSLIEKQRAHTDEESPIPAKRYKGPAV